MTYTFQLTEQTLRALLEEMTHCEIPSNQELRLQVIIEFTRNGLGFKAYNKKIEIVAVQNTTQAQGPKTF